MFQTNAVSGSSDSFEIKSGVLFINGFFTLKVNPVQQILVQTNIIENLSYFLVTDFWAQICHLMQFFAKIGKLLD